MSVLLPDVRRMPSGGRGLSNVLPSTEFGYPSADGNKIRLLGDAPNTPWKRPPPEDGRQKGVF